jgi:hypothetical protein
MRSSTRPPYVARRPSAVKPGGRRPPGEASSREQRFVVVGEQVRRIVEGSAANGVALVSKRSAGSATTP